MKKKITVKCIHSIISTMYKDSGEQYTSVSSYTHTHTHFIMIKWCEIKIARTTNDNWAKMMGIENWRVAQRCGVWVGKRRLFSYGTLLFQNQFFNSPILLRFTHTPTGNRFNGQINRENKSEHVVAHKIFDLINSNYPNHIHTHKITEYCI